VCEGATSAYGITLEERKRVVLLVHLDHLTARQALGAAYTLASLSACDGGSHNVLAGLEVAVKVEVLALAGLSATEANLVDAGTVMLRRYVPDTLLVADVLGVLCIESAASVDSGGGLLERWVRYSLYCHQDNPLVVGPRGVGSTCGAILLRFSYTLD
jgi:hypothetical protein